MSHYTTPEGVIIKFPDFSDRALLNVSPSTFVRKLIAANPCLPCRLLTCDNVMYVFQGMLTHKNLKDSSFPDVRIQQSGLFDRWRASADWEFLRQVLTEESYMQRHTSFSPPKDGPLEFKLGVLEFSIPAVTPDLFSCDGLDVQQFIEALKRCNPTRKENLSTQAVKIAVGEFAAQRFPSAAPGLGEKFAEQLRTARGTSALVNHQIWLKPAREKSDRDDIPRQGMRDNRRSSSTGLVCTGSFKIISGKTDTSNAVTGAIDGIASKKPLISGSCGGPARASIPEIRCMDEKQKTTLISQGRSLHVSLESAKVPNVSTLTHIHLLNATKESSRKVEVITSYNRSIAVEFENRDRRNEFAEHLAGIKFTISSQIVSPSVDRLRMLPRTFNTKWSFFCSNKDHPYVIHEALRRFFCNEGYIAADDVIIADQAGLSKTKVRVRQATSPVWICYLASGVQIQEEYLLEAMPAGHCAICAPLQYDEQHKNLQMEDSAAHDRRPPKPEVRFPTLRKAEPAGSVVLQVSGSLSCRGASGPMNEMGSGSRPNLFPTMSEQRSSTYAAPNEVTKKAMNADTRLSIASWKILESRCSRLEQVTAANFVDGFVKVNGNEAFRTASAADLVRAFNLFLSTHFPDADFQAKSKSLRRLDPNAPLGAFNPLYQELLDFEHLLKEPAKKVENKPLKRQMDELSDGTDAVPRKLQKIDPDGLTGQESAESAEVVDTFLSSLEQHLQDKLPQKPNTTETVSKG